MSHHRRAVEKAIQEESLPLTQDFLSVIVHEKPVIPVHPYYYFLGYICLKGRDRSKLEGTIDILETVMQAEMHLEREYAIAKSRAYVHWPKHWSESMESLCRIMTRDERLRVKRQMKNNLKAESRPFSLWSEMLQVPSTYPWERLF